MPRVLVLGGSSYVAQFALQRHLAAAQSEGADDGNAMACTMRGQPDSCPLPAGFMSADPQTSSSSRPSSSHVHVYWGVDLGAMTGVRESICHFRPDVVINCVAMSSPAACEKEPERAQKINEPRALVEFLAHEIDWNVRFVHFSTDFVYDGANPPPRGYKEGDAGAIRSSSSEAPKLTVYGASKLAFDSFLLARQSNNLSGVILRLANVIGPQSPLFADQPPKFMEWLHQQLFSDSSSNETKTRSLQLWSDEVRSFIYVRDLAAILFALLESEAVSPPTPSRFLLLNIGGRDALSRVDLAERYFEACQRVDCEQMPRATIAPTSRASVSLGYHPPLNATLNTTLLRRQLPSLVLTSTDRILKEICRELLSK